MLKRWPLLVVTACVCLLAGLTGGYFIGREQLKRELVQSLERRFTDLGLDAGDNPRGKGGARPGVPSASDDNTALVYARDSLQLYDVTARYADDVLDGRVAGVFGKVRNLGSRTLSRVEVTAYFLNTDGAVIHENDYPAVSVGSVMGSDPPLKPNYIREFGFKTKDCPSEWAAGRVRVAVTDISFE